MSMVKYSAILAAVLAVLLSGCAASSWSGGGPVATTPISTDQSGSAVAQATAPAVSDTQQLQQVIAEVQLLGQSDPAIQQRVLDDLRTNDPTLWPLIVKQAKATAAYRQRAIATRPAERLPPVNAVAAVPVESQTETYLRSPEAGVAVPSGLDPQRVVQASYPSPITGDWRERLADAIDALERDVAKRPQTPGDLAEHARLRMLYAAAGRREDASRPIPAAPEATQQFLAKEFEGVAAWLDTQRMPDPAARAAEAKPMLAEALSNLAAAAPLLVRNAAFCTEVQSYGCVKRFEKYEFQPDQQVLLYAEVENFASEPTAKGYHTSLQSSYEVVDGNGKRIAERTFTPTEEHCQNLRRDFFIGYHVRLPKSISPGRYTLRLRIEDVKCRKVGQAAVEFEIKEAAGRDAKA